jgi:hypothetical protein
MNDKRISLLAIASPLLAATAIVSAALFLIFGINWLLSIPLLATLGGLGSGIGSLIIMKTDPRLTGRAFAISGILLAGTFLILILVVGRLPQPT